MYAEDSPTASTISIGVECGRCVNKLIFFKEGTPCGFYMAMFGFRETYDCGDRFASCKDVLKINEGTMHGSCVEENGCDFWM